MDKDTPASNRAARDPFHISKLIAMTKLWRMCPVDACRRQRRCTDHARCEREHWETVRWFKRRYVLPHLRKRFPSVQWGAPAGIVELQLEAALAAEKAAPPPRPAKPKRRPRSSTLRAPHFSPT